MKFHPSSHVFFVFFGNIIANITPVDTFVASIHPFWASKKCQDAYSVPTRYQDHNLGKKNSQHCLGWSASHFQSLPAEVFHLLGVCFWGPIIYIYIPGTQMTLVLLEQGLVLEGLTPNIEDKQVPGIYIYISLWRLVFGNLGIEA